MLLLAGAAALLAANQASAQEAVVVEEDVTILDAPCHTNYYTTKSQNWFIEIGAGINVPFVEGSHGDGGERHITANYGVGFGKWFSPYLGWRFEAQGGAAHWENGGVTARFKMVNANIDLMWDMLNSFNVKSNRVVSIIPFLGIGGTYAWDYRKGPDYCVPSHKGHARHNEWLLPVSAGLQLRFRLCKYVDFFAQARCSFYGDSFNNFVVERPVDMDLTALGGFSFNIGGRSFNEFNPCDYTAYINGLNDQVNALRGELATTAAALAAANAQLPCPEVVEAEAVVVDNVAPLLATVRFTIDSSKITNMEKINVYNVAEWMKANEDQNVLITGYADKQTGTSAYNMALSERRAKAVYNMLVNEYGISADRLATAAAGSDVQPYNINNWNRIVVFSVAE